MGASALAQQLPLQLEWSAPPDECPNEAAVRVEVIRLLSAKPVETIGPSVRAHATIALKEDGHSWSLNLRTEQSGVSGERILEGDTCKSVADAGALILALMLDPSLAPAPPPPPPEPPPPIEPPARAQEREVPPPVRQAGAQGRLIQRNRGIYLWPALAFDVGSMPKPALGIEINGGIEYALFLFELALTYFPAHSFDNNSFGAGDVSLFTAGVKLCRVFHVGPLDMGPCALFEIGSIRGRFIEFFSSDSFENASLWTAAGVQGFFDWPLLSWLAPRIDFGMLIPFQKSRFLVNGLSTGVNTAGETSSVVFRAQFGVEIRY